MRTTLALFLLILVNASTFCQELYKEFVPLKRMKITAWSGKSGQEFNNITSTAQCRHGYLWLTTFNGIQRFDGHNTELYDQSKLRFLNSNGFRNIHESLYDSTLYFASQSSGILTYRNNEFTQLKVKNGQVPNSIESIYHDENGSLWIGTIDDGLHRIVNDSIYKIPIDLIKYSNILCIYMDEEARIWIGTEGQGIILIDRDQMVKNFTVSDGLASDIVNVIRSLNNSIYVGTQAGFNKVTDNKVENFDFLQNESINDVFFSEGFLWFGTDNGLARYHLQYKSREFHSSINGIDVSRVNNIIKDREGSFWIATGRNGLIQLRETGIINYTVYDGLASDNINVISENFNKTGFYIGCDDGKIYELNSDTLSQLKLINSIQPTGIRDILEEEDGTLWIASYRGVIRKKGEQEFVYNLENGMPSLDARKIIQDHKGNIIIGTRSGGLIKIENNLISEIYNRSNQLKSDFILSMEEHQNGDIYLGTHSGGLAILKPDGKILNFNITQNDIGLIVFNVHIDSNGRIWLVTSNGLFYFDSSEFHKLELSSTFSGSMFDWLENANKDVWITSNQGVLQIKNHEIDNFLNDKQYKLNFRIIDESDGMNNKECTGAVSALEGGDGKLYIPTIDGCAVINPSKISENKIPPPVYIESLLADSLFYLEKNIEIPAGVSRYKFSYTALSYFNPDKLIFKYKLEGFDKEYTHTNNIRQVEYTNLPPGNYSFHVIAANNNGVWNEQGALFPFIVKPHFHQTNWFYILVVSTFFFFAYLIYKWRVKSLEAMNSKLVKVNNELDSFVYSASHDLRSPIASMLGLIDLSKRDKENISLYLEKMEISIRRLDDFIAEIIDFSSNERKDVSIEPVDFQNLIESVKSELGFLDIHNEVVHQIDVRQDEIFYSDIRRISIIFRNLISNSLKYRDSSKDKSYVKIKVSVLHGEANISISDNGIGIKKEEQENVFEMFYRATEFSSGSGLGLYIVNETILKLGGKLTLESVLYEGTIFNFSLPSLK